MSESWRQEPPNDSWSAKDFKAFEDGELGFVL
jgi:hypothetical protein